MLTDNTFDALYDQLASSWDTHQRLRGAHAPLPTLADSSSRLYQARLAMWDWLGSDTTWSG